MLIDAHSDEIISRGKPATDVITPIQHFFLPNQLILVLCNSNDLFILFILSLTLELTNQTLGPVCCIVQWMLSALKQ